MTFRAGTLIATPGGARSVEYLREGDQVLAHGGDGVAVAANVGWVGRRVVACARHPEPDAVWPVRIAKSAFGAGLPARDLYLSPDHAVFFGGALIPVRSLINDRNVAQIETDTVSYYHIELAQHLVISAEAMPAESFLDAGSRGNFLNGGVPLRLHPYFASRAPEGAAGMPFAEAGKPVDRALARLKRSWAEASGAKPQRGEKRRG
jgi:hypothetical protein